MTPYSREIGRLVVLVSPITSWKGDSTSIIESAKPGRTLNFRFRQGFGIV